MMPGRYAIFTCAILFVVGCLGQIDLPEIPQLVLSKVIESTTKQDGPCQQACAIIGSRRPESVFIGQTGDFQFWDAKQAEVIPACRVEPSSTEEVSWVLSRIVEKGCHFAVKSGGHDRTPGSSNADGGITIDFVRFNAIELAEDKQSVRVGAGLRWDDVYQNLEQEKLMVLGGRVADVGVGGLLLGGGISYFSNEFGLAFDSILAYEMVLPNATIVTVRQKSHPDLFRALRGAGASNFGIVTSFTLETFPLRDVNIVWNGHKLYPSEDLERFVEANYKLVTEVMDTDPGMAMMNMFVCQARHSLCHGVAQHHHTRHASNSTWPESFKVYEEITGLPQTVRMELGPMSDITRGLAGSSPAGKHRTIYGTFTYIPSVELELQMFEIFRQEVESVRDMAGFLPGIIMHPLSRIMIAKMHKHGGNSLRSINAEEGPFIIMNISWQWFKKVDDDRSYAAYYRAMNRIEEAARQLGVWHPYKYINYAEATQDVWNGYGEETAIGLRRLQAQIDPSGIFTKHGLARGFFKLNERRPSENDVLAAIVAEPLRKSEL